MQIYRRIVYVKKRKILYNNDESVSGLQLLILRCRMGTAGGAAAEDLLVVAVKGGIAAEAI